MFAKIFKISFILAAISVGAPAFATCSLPYGSYAGSGAGDTYQGTSLSNVFSFTVYGNFAADGSATLYEKGKSPNGRYTNTYKIPAKGKSGHQFDTNTCIGIITINNENLMYTSTNSGSHITFQYYTDNTKTSLYIMALDKL